ncbi:MAG: sterol desaturase family protein [Pseudomonadota bacterium]
MTDYLERVTDPFINPQKRIFLGYLATAIVIAVVAQMIASRMRLREAISAFFARRIWLSSSAIADYKILLVNHALMMGIIPRLASKLVVATIIFEALHVWLNGRVLLWPGAPAWVIACAFTLTLFLLDDLSKYLVHRALHRWSVLWAFHKVHHSAEVLTPLTVYRTHPVEGIFFALRSVLVQALAIAVFLFFFGDRTSLVTILGANAFLFLFNVAGSNLRHSHVWISYGKTLEHWLISPAQHQIHHSIEKEHHDRNFGAVLAIWDRIGGSLYLADSASKVRFGDESGEPADHRLLSLYISPLLEAVTCLARPVTRVFSKMRAAKMSSVVRWSLFIAMAAFAVWAVVPPATLAG